MRYSASAYGCASTGHTTPASTRTCTQARRSRRTTLSNDSVNHPAHYGGDGPYETIKVLEAWDSEMAFGFCVGNAIKYLSRAGKKNPMTLAEDLEKAAWYAKEAADMAREKMLDAVDAKLARESEDVALPYYWDKDGDLWAHTDECGGGWYFRWGSGKDWGEPESQFAVASLEELRKDYGPLRAAHRVAREKKEG